MSPCSGAHCLEAVQAAEAAVEGDHGIEAPVVAVEEEEGVGVVADVVEVVDESTRFVLFEAA